VELNTASAAVSFAKQLEEESAEMYEQVGNTFPAWNEAIWTFMRENTRNASSIDRAYFNVVSDALDTGFAFGGVDADDYALLTVPEGTHQSHVLDVLVANENRIIAYYNAVGDSSRNLMADLPRAFDRVAVKHGRRLEILKGLLT